jgi:hypothetical protein
MLYDINAEERPTNGWALPVQSMIDYSTGGRDSILGDAAC